MTEKKCNKKIDAFSADGDRIKERESAFTKAMVESLPGSFSINDANGRLVWWNAYHRDEIVGKDESEMCYSDALEVFHPADKALALEKMLNVLNFGIEETSEGRVLLRGGPKFQWRMITGKRIIIDGNPFVVAVGIDITERKRSEVITAFRLCLLDMMENNSTEELLKVTLEEVERITESSFGFFHVISDDQATFLMRVSSTDTQINRAVPEEKTLNFTLNEEEILAHAIREKRTVIDNNYTVSTNQSGAQDTPSSLNRILFVPLMRGVTVTALLCVGGKLYDYDEDDARMVNALANLAWDIVARKRAELSEQKIQEVLLQAQKMELIGQLAGGIAHDFNNMLGVILGNVEMAINHQAIEEPLLSNMKAILRATEHSADLTNQLLAFSRKQSVMPIVLDLNTMVERMLTVLRRLIGENISLVWRPEQQSTPVKIDPSQIDMILGNLCVNSRDAIHGIGTITIETRRVHVERSQCSANHPCKEPGDYIMLVVTDNGSGIAKKDLPHIFEPFFTTKEKKSIGLGLSTIYGIIKQNSAFIECLSEQGKGTTFRIYLQRNIGYADQEESEQLIPSVGRSKEVILLVEDEPDILNICKLMLENKGYTVLDAAAPSDAIRIACEHRGQIHLLITDVVLPEMNGCDLSKKLQSIFPNLKTLFMSGYTTDVINNQGVLDLGVNFIQKPFSINALILAIHKIFALA